MASGQIGPGARDDGGGVVPNNGALAIGASPCISTTSLYDAVSMPKFEWSVAMQNSECLAWDAWECMIADSVGRILAGEQ